LLYYHRPAKEAALPLSQLPDLLSVWLSDIAAAVDRRSALRLLLLLIGALFAKGRRPP
jgi:hypothetical protein